jgi:hypothetical protein
LQGFEALWQLVMELPESRGALLRSAIGLLIRLHSPERLSPSLNKQIAPLRKHFVATCMTFLSASYDSPVTITRPGDEAKAAAAAASAAAGAASGSAAGGGGEWKSVGVVSSGASGLSKAEIELRTRERIARCLLLLRCFVRGEKGELGCPLSVPLPRSEPRWMPSLQSWRACSSDRSLPRPCKSR